MVVICGKVEAELVELPPAERAEFLASMGMTEPGLNRLVRAGYDLLDLITYFTSGGDECRAWTVHRGDTAPKAAGVIHTDFEKGFIKAEVIRVEDLLELKTEAACREKGKLRIEGQRVRGAGRRRHALPLQRLIARAARAPRGGSSRSRAPRVSRWVMTQERRVMMIQHLASGRVQPVLS